MDSKAISEALGNVAKFLSVAQDFVFELQGQLEQAGAGSEKQAWSPGPKPSSREDKLDFILLWHPTVSSLKGIVDADTTARESMLANRQWIEQAFDVAWQVYLEKNSDSAEWE